MNRFHREPRATAPPFGFDDLPVAIAGEVSDDMFAEFTPHATPYDVDQLTRPWTGRGAHPRCVIARELIRENLGVELGWRAAAVLVDAAEFHHVDLDGLLDQLEDVPAVDDVEALELL